MGEPGSGVALGVEVGLSWWGLGGAGFGAGESGGVEWGEASGGGVGGEAVQRSRAREASVGRGSVGLVRPGRSENTTGKLTASEAADIAVRSTSTGAGSERDSRSRESLMVGPTVQPIERRAEAAADSDASSRWPRHMLMIR